MVRASLRVFFNLLPVKISHPCALPAMIRIPLSDKSKRPPSGGLFVFVRGVEKQFKVEAAKQVTERGHAVVDVAARLDVVSTASISG